MRAACGYHDRLQSLPAEDGDPTPIAIAKTGMLIRKPVEQVFEAIVNPDITTKILVQQTQRKTGNW